MLKYVSKFALDILPSVVATILGAYIVNHYIVTKPAADASVAAAMSRADPKKADVRTGAKPSESSADVGNIPERGVKAKGISEKAILEKTAAEKPAVAEKPQEKESQEKSAEKPVETASIPADARRHQPGPREKAVAKSAPAPVSPPMPAAAVAPVIAAPNTAPPVEMAAPVEEHRDANDLARAAIERLRGASEGSPRPQESARVPDAPRVVSAPSVAAPLRVQPRRFGRFRRRSWSPRPQPRRSAARRDPHERGPLARPPPESTIRAARRRRPTFRRPLRRLRDRSICARRPWNPQGGNTRRSPKTCCWRQSRCFTRCCRNTRTPDPIEQEPGLRSKTPGPE